MNRIILLNTAAVFTFIISGCSMQRLDYKSLNRGFWLFYSEDATAELSNVWQQQDDIWICRGKPLGYIFSGCRFTDFVLSFEWRWPENQAGKGGVLLRMTGEHKIWPKSLEAQINAGSAGDFWGLDGYALTGPSDRLSFVDHEKFGRLTNLEKIRMLEKDPGRWNSYKIIAKGDIVTLIINGTEINRAEGCDITAGHICLTSEGSEIHFRNIRFESLD